jgi:hypothetical protein
MNRRDFFVRSTAAGAFAMGLPRTGLPSPVAEDATKPTPVLEVPVLGLRLRLHFSVDAPVTEWRPVQQQSDSSIFVGGPFRVTVRPKPLTADVVTVEVEIQREDGGSFEINSARVTMAVPMAGIYHTYALPSMIGQSFQPDIKGFDVWSTPVGGIPLSFLMGLNGDNVLTVGLLDQTTITRLQGQFYGGESVDETTAANYQSLGVANNNYYLSFDQLAAVEEPLQTRRHSLVLFVSRQRTAWEKVFTQYASWVDEQRHFQARPESSYALDPMWHSWYAFGEYIDAKKMEDNARIGKELGLTNIQFDAGWNTSLPYTLEIEGDYRFVTDRFPNFLELVEKFHANGQRAIVHWSPFVLGPKSPAYPKMQDAIMQTDKGKELVLCPRTRAATDHVAEFTRRMMEDYKLDGLWFDFIDSVPVRRCIAPHRHDFASLGEGVTAALRQSAETAVRLNKNVILVYRQSFANLNNKPFLTHVWPVDAPFDFNMNRREVLFMKPYAHGVLTHACCTCWHRAESDENVARHMASVVLAGVPAVSVDLVTIPESHRKIIRSWVGFYNQHRDELVHGEMSPLAFFPAAGALSIAGKTRNYIGLFETVPSLIELQESRNEIYLVNCTGERLVTSLANLRGRFSCKVYNHLLAPVRELDLCADGELRLDVKSPPPFLIEVRRV